MQRVTSWLTALILLSLALPAFAQSATGTLVMQVAPFTSEVKLKKKVQSQLASGGLEWGIKDDLVVISMVNKRFIDFPINHMTRYGTDESLVLPVGDYRITGIGLEMVTAFSAEKALDKGAFLNEDTLSFRIEAGQTTTISINPIIRKEMTFLLKWYMPALMTRIVTAAGTGEETAINLRNERSIAWPSYHGPLKFVAQ